MYPDNVSGSARLYERALKVMPGGNSRHTVFFAPHPIYAAKAEGARVWDADGAQRLDLINNYSALIHGHEVYSFRLGFNGAQGALGVTPELTALGKVIGGGLPVGAVGGRADIMDALFDPRSGRPRLSHGGTFNANPLTMAAGAAAMQLFDRAAFDRLSGLGERLRKGLREAIEVAGVPATVRGATSMTALAHFDDEPEDYRSLVAARAAYPAARERAEQFFRILLNEGVMIGASGLFVLSTALSEADIDQVIEASLKALRRL